MSTGTTDKTAAEAWIAGKKPPKNELGPPGRIRTVPREVPVRDETIRLGQLLKLVGAIDSGSEAKTFLASESVHVNDEREVRRGRQLHVGDTVVVGDQRLRVTARRSA
jgi:ribosome-associated protein